MEALRYPDDYDGIIAGAPAFQVAREFAPFLLMAARAQAANPISVNDLKVVDNATREACDLLDGINDGVIDDPRQCNFNPEVLLCRNGDTRNYLSSSDIDTFKQMYKGVVDPDGTIVSPGVLPGAEAAGDWAGWVIGGVTPPGPGVGARAVNDLFAESFGHLIHQDPNIKADDFDIYLDRDELEDTSAILDINEADFTKFRKKGGKLLMFQGWNDYPLRPQRAINYLASAEKENGGANRTAAFMPLFMVPGMLHCGLGPGPSVADYLTPLTAWVEKGTAPDVIPAAHVDADGRTAFTRKFCAYPTYGKYAGEGDETDGSNYACLTDP